MLVISQDGNTKVRTTLAYGCKKNYSVYAVPSDDVGSVKVAEYKRFDSMMDALMSCHLALNNNIQVFQFPIPKEEE